MTSRIVIRRAKSEDVPEILVLLQKLHAYAGFGECAPFDLDSAGKFTLRLMGSSRAEVIVADKGGDIVGLSTFIVDSPYFNWDTKVANGISFWVEPEYRKTGVGKALYETSEKMAKALGCKAITVGVMVADEYLQQYHERNGFERREIISHKRID